MKSRRRSHITPTSFSFSMSQIVTASSINIIHRTIADVTGSAGLREPTQWKESTTNRRLSFWLSATFWACSRDRQKMGQFHAVLGIFLVSWRKTRQVVGLVVVSDDSITCFPSFCICHTDWSSCRALPRLSLRWLQSQRYRLWQPCYHQGVQARFVECTKHSVGLFGRYPDPDDLILSCSH